MTNNDFQGQRGLILGVANNHSIAWGIAQALAASGAELAFTYQSEPFLKRVEPLAKSIGSTAVFSCDVEVPEQISALFTALRDRWGTLDFLVHSLAYSDRNELSGRYVDTTSENFRRTLNISCYSFTALAGHARPLMSPGGSLLTLSYYGAERVMPSYNVMGVAKAALEASIRYLAADLGPEGIRVNAISAGPMRTLAGSAIGSARKIYNYAANHAPLRQSVTLKQLGGAALYLLGDQSAGVTGEVHHVDMGYNTIGLPNPVKRVSE